MKRLLTLILAALTLAVGAQTFPVQNLQVNGTSQFTGTMSGTGLTAHDANVNHVQIVSNVAALQSTACVSGLIYQTQGYYTSTGGGSLQYLCVGSDTTTPANGSTIIVASNGIRYHAIFNGTLSVLQGGAKCDGSTDDQPAIQAMVTAGINSILIPSGTCVLNETLTISGTNGFHLFGVTASLNASGVPGTGSSVLKFDGATPHSTYPNGINVTTFTGLIIENLVITQNWAGIDGGNAIFLSTGHNFRLSNVNIYSNTGTGGSGIVLGGGSGATSTFQGLIENSYVAGVAGNAGVAFYSNNSNTSLSFINDYATHSYYYFTGTIYSSLISCAMDGATGYGYNLNNVGNISIISSGGEGEGLGVFYIQGGSYGVTLSSPQGVGNNVSAGSGFGDLVQIDSSSGANQAIAIINPSSTSPSHAVTANVYATSGTGIVTVDNATSSQLAAGVGGDATWLLTNATVTGASENMSFSPTLGTGWTNSGTPVLTGTYNKKGKQIAFTVTITPGTNISAAAGAKLVLPWSTGSVTSAGVFSGTTAFSVAVVNASSITLTQATGTLTAPLTISGFILEP